MVSQTFAFTRADIQAYETKHQYAQLMFCGARDDNAAAVFEPEPTHVVRLPVILSIRWKDAQGHHFS